MIARLVLASALLVGCDDRQALHRMHPSFERMQVQEKVDPFDGRGMKAPPRDTVAREDESDVAPDAGLPMAIDRPLLEEGRAHYDRVCASCHGVLGDGDSVVATKMTRRKPPSLVAGAAAALPPRRVFEVITEGEGWMPSSAHELSTRERWATIAYLEALRLSRHAVVRELPADLQREIATGGDCR